MDTLSGSNSVKSWQIYDDHGNVTVRIKFCNGGDSGQSAVTSSSYMRKPKSKMDRDQKRAASFVENKRVTRSQSRKNMLSETEKPRNISSYSGEPLLDSPVLVDPDPDMPSQASDSALISSTPVMNMHQSELYNAVSKQNNNIHPSDICDSQSTQDSQSNTNSKTLPQHLAYPDTQEDYHILVSSSTDGDQESYAGCDVQINSVFHENVPQSNLDEIASQLQDIKNSFTDFKHQLATIKLSETLPDDT